MIERGTASSFQEAGDEAGDEVTLQSFLEAWAGTRLKVVCVQLPGSWRRRYAAELPGSLNWYVIERGMAFSFQEAGEAGGEVTVQRSAPKRRCRRI